MGDITQEMTDLFCEHFEEWMMPIEEQAKSIVKDMKAFQTRTIDTCTKERDAFLKETRKDLRWAKRDFITRIMVIILVVADITIKLLDLFLWRK